VKERGKKVNNVQSKIDDCVVEYLILHWKTLYVSGKAKTNKKTKPS
jgi:hypothetical protein